MDLNIVVVVLLVEMLIVLVKLVVDEWQIFLMLLMVNQYHFDTVVQMNKVVDMHWDSLLVIVDSSSEHQRWDSEDMEAYTVNH